jgi:hypothetical protein
VEAGQGAAGLGSKGAGVGKTAGTGCMSRVGRSSLGDSRDRSGRWLCGGGRRRCRSIKLPVVEARAELIEL